MAEAKNTAPAADFDAAATRVRELNEQIIAAAKKNQNVSLDFYEKSLSDLIQFSQKAADATEVEAISAIAKAHNDYISSLSKTFTGVARDALK